MSFWSHKGADDAHKKLGPKSPQQFKDDTSRKDYQAGYHHKQREDNQQKNPPKK
jgi:hypothetical protein